mmetsp:Transcript_35628/g.72616  ORF Transcript_35628/g.72616 Transcript_35628/m.72616 type:complete len:365 (-) Transcript_35628:172-1266(-)
MFSGLLYLIGIQCLIGLNPTIALLVSPITSQMRWVEPHAIALQREGFVALPEDASVGRELSESVAKECKERLEFLLEAVDSAGCDLIEQQYSFSEICHRKRLRWDLRMPRTRAWDEMCRLAVEVAAPVLRTACNCADDAEVHVVMSGVVTSRPGALQQSFHADGESGLFNIFVPLVDIKADDDGTQFWPGSHLTDPSMETVLDLPQNEAAMSSMVAPGCLAGGMVCFDYRTIHRGLPSSGRERAVAYIVVSTDSRAQDRKNFPDLSVHDATPEHTEYIPFFEERVGDHWRAMLPRMNSLLIRLINEIKIDKKSAFNESTEMDVKRSAMALVRGFCRDNGLDEFSIQARIQATNALIKRYQDKET